MTIFKRKKETPKKKMIDLGSINHSAPTIHEALWISKETFDECIKKAVQSSGEELARELGLKWEQMKEFQSKNITDRVSKVWEIKKRIYEISLETFIKTILVYRTFATDCVPCGTGEVFKAGMLSDKNELGACVTPGCHSHGIDGHHGWEE